MKQQIFFRKSVRAFKSQLVDKELLCQWLTLAGRAPSSKNTQPWDLTLVSGEMLALIRQQIQKAINDKRLENMKSVPMGEKAKGRAKVLAQDLKPVLEQQGWTGTSIFEGSLNFFNAPHVLFVRREEGCDPHYDESIGIFEGYALLAAEYLGLGTVVLGYPKVASSIIAQCLGWNPGESFLSAIAVGYPTEDPINHFQSGRRDLQELVRFVS